MCVCVCERGEKPERDRSRERRREGLGYPWSIGLWLGIRRFSTLIQPRTLDECGVHLRLQVERTLCTQQQAEHPSSFLPSTQSRHVRLVWPEWIIQDVQLKYRVAGLHHDHFDNLFGLAGPVEAISFFSPCGEKNGKRRRQTETLSKALWWIASVVLEGAVHASGHFLTPILKEQSWWTTSKTMVLSLCSCLMYNFCRKLAIRISTFCIEGAAGINLNLPESSLVFIVCLAVHPALFGVLLWIVVLSSYHAYSFRER